MAVTRMRYQLLRCDADPMIVGDTDGDVLAEDCAAYWCQPGFTVWPGRVRVTLPLWVTPGCAELHQEDGQQATRGQQHVRD